MLIAVLLVTIYSLQAKSAEERGRILGGVACGAMLLSAVIDHAQKRKG